MQPASDPAVSACHTASAVVPALCARLAAQPCDCPPTAPPIEVETGANLYWHLPGECWVEGCEQTVQTDCFGYAPRWYAMAELQGLQRVNLDTFEFASNDVITYGIDSQTGGTFLRAGNFVLDTESFDDQWKAGGRVLFGVTLSDWYRVEASYRGGFEWDNTTSVRSVAVNDLGGAGNLFTPFTDFGNPPVAGVDYNTFVLVGFESKIDDVQLNVRRHLPMPPGPFEASMLLGIRYTRLTEEFSYLSVSNTGVGSETSVEIATDNDMIGPQIGFLGQWIARPRTWVDYEIIGSVLSNSSELTAGLANGVGQDLFTNAGSDQERAAAGLLDMSLMLNHQFTRCLTFRGVTRPSGFGAAHG